MDSIKCRLPNVNVSKRIKETDNKHFETAKDVGVMLSFTGVLTAIGGGMAIGFAAVATGGILAIVGGGVLAAGLLTFGVSEGLSAIKPQLSQFIGNSGNKINNAHNNIVNKLNKRISQETDPTLTNNLKKLRQCIKDLGPPREITGQHGVYKGPCRAKGYPKIELEKVVNFVKNLAEEPREKLYNAIQSLEISDSNGFKGIGISLQFKGDKNIDYDKLFSSFFDSNDLKLDDTEYRKIEHMLEENSKAKNRGNPPSRTGKKGQLTLREYELRYVNKRFGL